MKAITLSTPKQEWAPASYRFGENSTYKGAPLTQEKVLSDRRGEGGGIAFLLKFSPPDDELHLRRGEAVKSKDLTITIREAFVREIFSEIDI